MFRKILVANRGEIACRIARTCRRLGIAVAGVHSEADRDALHVRTIGDSVLIGPAPAAESYLNGAAIIAAARAAGADAIHPGFGFLAENGKFAEAVLEAGLAFVGPSAETLACFGNKAAAKQAAASAGVPIVPGSTEASADPGEIARIVRGLPLPILLKAAAGGGGKGMRVVRDIVSLEDDIAAAMREAQGAFGDPALIVESYLSDVRHIEVQILGDGRGKVIHLFERECSLQRRHQKVIEEAPAPHLPSRLRERLLEDSCRLGASTAYLGLGTVEFVVAGDRHYFLEVNPRLQVEHPVTESITGLDLIELQLRVTSGEPLPLEQDKVEVVGHAIEARFYAEDPNTGFLPSTGTLHHVRLPTDRLRVDAGVETGDAVTPYYDPMIAKLIAHAPTRDAALARLAEALSEAEIVGVRTNQGFLRELLSRPAVQAGRYDTTLIDRNLEAWTRGSASSSAEMMAAAALLWLLDQRSALAIAPATSWRSLTGWRLDAGDGSVLPAPVMRVSDGKEQRAVRFSRPDQSGCHGVAVDDDMFLLRISARDDHRYAISDRHRTRMLTAAIVENEVHIAGHGSYVLEPYLERGASATADAANLLRAPMMGKVIQVNAAAGTAVLAGDILAIIESMKMEIRITAPRDGIVKAVSCQAGESIERGDPILELAPQDRV